MDYIRRLLGRIQGLRTPQQHGSAKLSIVVETNEVTIPPFSTDLVGDELKAWVAETAVILSPVDGVWWHHGELEDTLVRLRHGEGRVGLYFHGGGYMIGSAKDVRSGSSRIPHGLVEHGVCSCILSLEYSLVGAKEDEVNHAFPLQILEALSAYHHLVHALNIPSKRIILVGDSAGGHLALALQRYLLLHKSDTLSSPGGLILLSPWCDLSVEAHIPHVQRLLGPLSIDRLSSPYFSPALNAPPPRWPPTLVYYGATEGFAASIVALASQLAEGGSLITTYAAKNIPTRFSHDFLIFVSVERAWPTEVRKCWARLKAWTDTLDA